MAQGVKHLPSKHEAKFKPQNYQKKKKAILNYPYFTAVEKEKLHPINENVIIPKNSKNNILISFNSQFTL
jgi:hypothetical protein